MFEKHPEYDEPADDAVLWRYKDIPRYLDLLIKQKLFFARADKFEDPYEGKLVEHGPIENKRNGQQKDQDSSAVHGPDPMPVNQPGAGENGCINRTLMTISSWHNNMEENYAMWNIYARGNYGVAIQTSYKSLKAAFNNTNRVIHIGRVKYYNDNEPPISSAGSHTPFLRKRAIYQYENEVRCCYVMDQKQAEDLCWEDEGTYNGVFIDVDINVLIERIYISPYSPGWIHQIVRGINEKFNLDKEIVHSSVFDASSY